MVGRFVNADDAEIATISGSVLEHNLFAYCENNFVNCIDPSGRWLARLICGVAGAAIFGTIANVFCRILGIVTTTRRWITVGFAALGGIRGAVLGQHYFRKLLLKP